MRQRTINRIAQRDPANANKLMRGTGSRHPFKHALAMAEAIAKIRDLKADPVTGEDLTDTDRTMMLDSLPIYRSRGHGGSHRTKNAMGSGRTKRDRSKYDPAEEDLKHTPVPARTPGILARIKALHL